MVYVKSSFFDVDHNGCLSSFYLPHDQSDMTRFIIRMSLPLSHFLCLPFQVVAKLCFKYCAEWECKLGLFWTEGNTMISWLL
jgi:hypothetical protein